MREILFRGKTEYGEWVEGYLIHDEFCNVGVPYIGYLNWDGHNVDEVIPETVGQYTGLTDKNGKKIFEGDIITDCDGNVFFVKYFGDGGYPAFDVSPEIETVECNGLSFLNALDCLEVIGNIHDNPELLKGGE